MGVLKGFWSPVLSENVFFSAKGSATLLTSLYVARVLLVPWRESYCEAQEQDSMDIGYCMYVLIVSSGRVVR